MTNYEKYKKYENYEWTSIVANRPRKDMLYFADEITSSIADIGDILTYYDGRKMASGPLVAIDEKIQGEIYTMNLTIQNKGHFVGFSVVIPYEKYCDCTVTMSCSQDLSTRPEKVSVSGYTYFRGEYVGTSLDEYNENNENNAEGLIGSSR